MGVNFDTGRAQGPGAGAAKLGFMQRMGKSARWRLVTAAALLIVPLRSAAALPGSEPSAPGSQSSVPSRALELAASARGITNARTLSMPASSPATSAREAVGLFYRTVVGVRLSSTTLDATLDQLQTLPPNARAAVVSMLDAMTQAQRLRTHAFALIAPGEILFTESVALRAQFAPETVSRTDALTATAIIERIDMRAMLQAAMLVQGAAEAAMPALTGLTLNASLSLPYDALVIGTGGDDIYERDVQLVIDPGGNDTYRNNAGGVLSSQVFDSTGGCVYGGGTTGKAPPNIDCTPLPSNLCTYDSLNRATGRDDLPVVGVPNHDSVGTGAGRDGACGNDARRDALIADTQDIATDDDSRGVAVLLDAAGSDTYSVGWSHDDPLFDLIEFCYPGDATKTNTNRDLFQGGTLAGIGMLWDDGPGNNTFRGRLNSQGSGHVGGVGMLFSTGGGDDLYWADRLSQGNGIAGGVGVLADTGGSNTYLLEPPVVYRNEFRPGGRECAQEGRAGQGQGGFTGVGVLWNEGAAIYRSVSHVTSPSAPYAPVLGPGGKPLLVRGGDAQGSGESFPIPGTPGGLVIGIGLLIDTGGTETVCGNAGKIDGASNVSQTPGTIDAACGRFNINAEVSAADVAAAAEHLGGGAVGVRVVMSP